MVKMGRNDRILMGCLIALILSVLSFLYYRSLSDLTWQWDNREEYSHGYLIPIVVAYFIWQKKTIIIQSDFRPSWNGFAIVVFGALLYIVGSASVLYVLLQYSFVIVLIGVLWALMGYRAILVIILPLLMLFFAIPLPEYVDVLLSSKLQLLSTTIGVALIQWFKIPVFQDGNLIDLGVYKLQVVEACNGLRYLFPLLSIGFMCVYMFKAPLWQRAIVFVSSIPITILMNSFRIGMIGVLVNGWGIAMAEGFLHDFEGWIVYMTCLGILILEMILINSFSQSKRPFAEVFTAMIDESEIPAINARLEKKKTNNLPLYLSVSILGLLSLFHVFQQRENEVTPIRKTFESFPLLINQWIGKHSVLPEDQLKILKLTDYVINDYRQLEDTPVNFYVAYYESQKRRAAPHSPRVCIPGGGWEITEMTRITVANAPINRLVIKKGNYKQLVYYWYQQRGRIIANEFTMKWYLFQDALFLNRTDGALVRLTTKINIAEHDDTAEQRLQSFFKDVQPLLDSYIPK